MPEINVVPTALEPSESSYESIKRRLLAAQLVQKQAADASQPIYHEKAAWAKALQGAIGGAMEGMAERDEAKNSAYERQLWASALGGQQGTPQPAPVAPQQAPAQSQPVQPVAPASAAMPMGDVPAMNMPRPEVQPTAKVWGDKEAEAAGLYEKPAQAAPISPRAATMASQLNPAIAQMAISPNVSDKTRAMGMQLLGNAMKPKAPIEVNGRLVDPNTFKVLADFSAPTTATINDTIVDTRTGQPIYQGQPKPQPVTVGETVIDARTGQPIYKGDPKPNIEYKDLPDGRVIGLDKNKVGQGVDVTPAGGGPTNPYALPGKATESQTASANYANRMVESHNILGKLEDAGTSAIQTGLSSVPLVNNMLVSADKQKLNQAQRDFVNAVLRKESGAAIGASEFDSATKQYFPQPGDSAETIAQKKINRETSIQGIMGGAGPTYKPPASFKPSGSSKPNTTASGVSWSIE